MAPQTRPQTPQFFESVAVSVQPEVHAVSFATGTVKVLQDVEATADAPAHSEYEYRP